jgi:hypothetical protein
VTLRIDLCFQQILTISLSLNDLGYEYNWIYPTAIFRREFNSSKDFNDLR